MKASDATSGLDSTLLKATCGGRQRTSTVGVSSTEELSIDLDLAGCSLRAGARDRAGHRSQRSIEPLDASVADARRKSRRIIFTGDWKAVSDPDAVHGTLMRTSRKSDTARMAFVGAQVAIVARLGRSGGLAKVVVDGEPVGTIDLYAATSDDRRVVFVHDLPRRDHVVVVRALGKGSARSEGTSIALDAILVLDRRR